MAICRMWQYVSVETVTNKLIMRVLYAFANILSDNNKKQ